MMDEPSSSSINITYELTGLGWATAHVQIGDRSADIQASYLSDALAELMAAASLLAKDVDEARATFTEEPGENVWVLKRTSEGLHVRIVSLPGSSWSLEAEARAPTLTEGVCAMPAFVRAVLKAALGVKETYGLEGYEAERRYPFPEEHLALLESRVVSLP